MISRKKTSSKVSRRGVKKKKKDPKRTGPSTQLNEILIIR